MGTRDGANEAKADGTRDGNSEGTAEGAKEGACEGTTEGWSEGVELGAWDGKGEGTMDGEDVGEVVTGVDDGDEVACHKAVLSEGISVWSQRYALVLKPEACFVF